MRKLLTDEEYGTLIAKRLHIEHLLKYVNSRYVWAVFVFVNGLITIATAALVAYFTGTMFVFPSLGPTAILFFMTPGAESVRPRNALLGHGIGIICGYLALVLTGLQNAPSVVIEGVSVERVIAASLALAATGAFMVVARSPHAPAGATTLIIALGFITHPLALVIIEVAVGVLVLQAVLIDRFTLIRATVTKTSDNDNELSRE